MSGSADWPAAATNPPIGEEDAWEMDDPLPQMAWEQTLAYLSELRRSRLDPHDAALVEMAMRWGRAHARYLQGEREEAA